MGKVIQFTGLTKLDIPVDTILENAKDKLDGVVILGFDKDGQVYAASTYADGGTVLWLLEVCRQRLMDSH